MHYCRIVAGPISPSNKVDACDESHFLAGEVFISLWYSTLWMIIYSHLFIPCLSLTFILFIIFVHDSTYIMWMKNAWSSKLKYQYIKKLLWKQHMWSFSQLSTHNKEFTRCRQRLCNSTKQAPIRWHKEYSLSKWKQ